MELAEVMTELEQMGNEQTRNMWLKHGASGPLFGVKVGDMKKIVKKVKKDHQLALALFDTGNVDARYLAGLIADEKQMTAKEMDHWVENANWHMICEYAVAGVAAESPHGWERGLAWIESDNDHIASAGWATLTGVISILRDEKLDLGHVETLLDRIQSGIHDASNRTRYTMNGFVIAVGSYIAPLTEKAQAVGKAIGKVHVDQGKTACKVPLATDYIHKIVSMGRVGKKRKKVRC